MLKASEVLERVHNEGRKCGRHYFYRDEPQEFATDLCALGFLAQVYPENHLPLGDGGASSHAKKQISVDYNIPFPLVDEIEMRYEGWRE